MGRLSDSLVLTPSQLSELEERVEGQLRSVAELQSSLAKWSQSLVSHAREVQAAFSTAGKKKRPFPEIGTMGAMVTTVQETLLAQATAQDELGFKIAREIVPKLDAFHKESSKVVLKRFNKMVGDQVRETEASGKALAKGRSDYEKLGRDSDKAREELLAMDPTGKPKPLAKATKKVTELEAKFSDAERTYQRLVSEHNSRMERYYDRELPIILDALEEFDMQRTRLVKEVMCLITADLSALPALCQEIANGYAATVEGMDDVGDAIAYVETSPHKGASPPPAVEMVPYEAVALSPRAQVSSTDIVIGGPVGEMVHAGGAFRGAESPPPVAVAEDTGAGDDMGDVEVL